MTYDLDKISRDYHEARSAKKGPELLQATRSIFDRLRDVEAMAIKDFGLLRYRDIKLLRDMIGEVGGSLNQLEAAERRRLARVALQGEE